MSFAVSVDRIPGLIMPLALLLAIVVACAWVPVMLWLERRRPSSYTRSPDYLASLEGPPSLAVWAGMTAAEQGAHDTKVLDGAEQAELDARADAQEAAQVFLESTVRTNALHHP